MTSETLSLKTIINESDFLREAVIVHWNTWKKKDLLLLANKLIEKVLDPRNAKEHYGLFLRKKNRKSVKQSEIIFYQPKPFKNPNTGDIKSVTAEHTKPSHKLSKAIWKGEK